MSSRVVVGECVAESKMAFISGSAGAVNASGIIFVFSFEFLDGCAGGSADDGGEGSMDEVLDGIVGSLIHGALGGC